MKTILKSILGCYVVAPLWLAREAADLVGAAAEVVYRHADSILVWLASDGERKPEPEEGP